MEADPHGWRTHALIYATLASTCLLAIQVCIVILCGQGAGAFFG